MSIKDDIKSNIVKKGITMTAVAEMMNTSQPALSQKINKETISYKDVLKLAKVLGYEIIWKDKDGV